MNKKTVIIWILCWMALPLIAQTSLEASQGDTLYKKAAYYQALAFYKDGLLLSKDSQEICYCKKQLAKCYTQLDELGNAENTYKDIIQTCKTDVQDLRNFARILHKAGEYEKAKRIYASCYHADTNDRFSYKNMYFCDTAKQAMDRITEVYLDNMHKINSVFDDVVNEVNNDTLYFLSARKGKKSEERALNNNQYHYRMYRWNEAASKVIESLPMPFGDGFTSTNLEGGETFFTRTEARLMDPSSSRTVIYRTKHSETGHSESLKFAFDDDSSTFGHPNLSPDGNMFFFVSDMPGGFGGMDVYFCRKKGSKWSAPVNLGPEVNTADNELFPFYFGQGILFFSSNGHAGFGGYDIYSAKLNTVGWGKTNNLSIPINSKGDDLALRCDKTKKVFYLSSNRAKGRNLDIYKVQQFRITELLRSWN